MVRKRKREPLPSGDGEDNMGVVGWRCNRTASFVMTLWLESGTEHKEPEWRWRVIQVQTGERRYFRRLSDLLAYISEQTGVPPPR